MNGWTLIVRTNLNFLRSAIAASFLFVNAPCSGRRYGRQCGLWPMFGSAVEFARTRQIAKMTGGWEWECRGCGTFMSVCPGFKSIKCRQCGNALGCTSGAMPQTFRHHLFPLIEMPLRSSRYEPDQSILIWHAKCPARPVRSFTCKARSARWSRAHPFRFGNDSVSPQYSPDKSCSGSPFDC